MLYREQEEEETIEQAKTQLERLRKRESGIQPSNFSSNEEPTQEITDTSHQSLEDIWHRSEVGEEVEQDSETDAREETNNPPLTHPVGLVHSSAYSPGTIRSSLVTPGHGESQISKAVEKRVAQPRPLGTGDKIRPQPTETVKTKGTCRSPTTGLFCLQAASANAPITLVTRHSLAQILGPALVIINTTGRGDKLLFGL